MIPTGILVRTFSALSLFATCLAVALRPAVAQEQIYRIDTVALSGESLPGNGDLPVDIVGGIHLTSSGELLVLGLWWPNNSAVFGSGLWHLQQGVLTPVVVSGAAVPGMEGEVFGGVTGHSPRLNGAGDVAFITDDRGTPSFRQSLYSGTPGSMSLIARVGEPAPGAGGLLFEALDLSGLTRATNSGPFYQPLYGPALNSNGDFVFMAHLVDCVGCGVPTVRGDGLWLNTANGLELLALTGDSAPGTGGTFARFLHYSLNDAGQIAFRALLDEPGSSSSEGLWIGTPGNFSLVAKTGDEAPGTNGLSFTEFASIEERGPVLNTQGDYFFRALLNGGDLNSDFGLWLFRNGMLELVARGGEPAPGTTGATFESLDELQIHGSGEIAFRGNLPAAEPGSDQGIWLGIPEAPDLAVRSGDPAPGTPGQTFVGLSGLGLNGSGEIAFSAQVDSMNDEAGIWVTNGTDVSPIVYPGQVLEVRPGDFRTVLTTYFVGNLNPEGGLITSFNGSGQVLVTVGFDDSTSGVFLATAVAADQPPIADAGLDQTVNSSQLVTLNGLGSVDPEGEALAYLWTLDGTTVGGSATTTVGPLSIGTHVAALTVTDPQGASASDSLTITVLNRAPIAQAGPDQTANQAAIVNLDGSESLDPDGDSLNYLWSLDGAPIGTDAMAPVGPFGPGVYTILLTVDDGRGASATDSLILTVTNTPPLADAGPDQTVQGPEVVTLDGSGSTDPDGDALTYSWALGGVEVATGPQPNVGPFAEGSYIFTLTVSDPAGATSSDSVTLIVLNAPPLADAGPDQTIITRRSRKRVTLDASASSDPDGTIVSYVWRLNGSVLGNGVSIRPRLRRGTNSVVLTVTDDDGASSTDEVVVIITRSSQVSSGN